MDDDWHEGVEARLRGLEILIIGTMALLIETDTVEKQRVIDSLHEAEDDQRKRNAHDMTLKMLRWARNQLAEIRQNPDRE